MRVAPGKSADAREADDGRGLVFRVKLDADDARLDRFKLHAGLKAVFERDGARRNALASLGRCRLLIPDRLRFVLGGLECSYN